MALVIYIVDRAEVRTKDGDTFVAFFEKDPTKQQGKGPLYGCKAVSNVDGLAFTRCFVRAKTFSPLNAVCAVVDSDGIFTFEAVKDWVAEVSDAGFAKYIDNKFSFTYNSVDADDTTNLILKNVFVGTTERRYTDLGAANFIDFDMLRQFNAGEKVAAVDALLELMNLCTGMSTQTARLARLTHHTSS